MKLHFKTIKAKARRIVDSVATGKAARAERQSRKLTLDDVAARMGISAPSVHYLEFGRTAWNAARVTQYRAAIAANCSKKSQPASPEFKTCPLFLK